MEVKKRRRFKSENIYDNKKGHSLFVKETGIKNINYDLFINVIEGMNLAIAEKTLSQKYELKIPTFGKFKIIKVKAYSKNNSYIDWGYYNKTGIRIPHRNSHSDGYMFKFHFYTFSKTYWKTNMYNFQLDRNLKKEMKNRILANKIQ